MSDCITHLGDADDKATKLNDPYLLSLKKGDKVGRARQHKGHRCHLWYRGRDWARLGWAELGGLCTVCEEILFD